MYYKDDWDKARERISAWWSGDIVDRVALQVYAPKEGCSSFNGNQYTSPDKYINPEVFTKMNEDYIQKTFYGGEAYPFYYIYTCPSIIAAYLGCDISFMGGSAWLTHCLKSIEDFKNIEFDRNNKWYKTTNAIIDNAILTSKDNYNVTLGDIGSSAEVLAYMLGAENLCFDIIDNPEEVKAAITKISKLWFELYDEMYTKLQKVQKGSCQWLMAWSEGKTYPLQCDFAAMLSPQKFEEFFIPELRAQCKFLDDPIFHLDGKEMLQHLDLLLDIEDLKAIQWCPGASAGDNTSMLQWIPVLKRIQAKKKSIHIEIDSNEIEPLLKEISPYGLMLNTRCSTEKEAVELLKNAEVWTCLNI